MSSDEQDIEKWKEKYYDQLDQLEKKENDWEKLETTLKRTIGRLSLAAEGQHNSLDRHIKELRVTIKSRIDLNRLDSIVDDISHILTKLEETNNSPERASISILEQILSQLKLSESLEKPVQKLLKQLKKATDAQFESLLKESITLLQTATSTDNKNTRTENPSSTKSTTGFLDRLFHSSKEDTLTNTPADAIPSFTSTLSDILHNVPWPDNIINESESIINNIKTSADSKQLKSSLQQLDDVLKKWPITSESILETTSSDELQTYKNCLIELLNRLDNPDSPNGKLSALKISTRDAQQKSELDTLSDKLSALLLEQVDLTPPRQSNSAATDYSNNSAASQPGIQELLIRLLEQLIVPADLQNDVDKMKHRLSQETDPTNWKALLKDVALLINSIRSRMQKEKHEFENFLQQVTDRLKAMDLFLQTETSSLHTTEIQGNEFDLKINNNVNDIRQNINDATELSSLKQNVNSKLDTISEHIKLYREIEIKRVKQSQDQVSNMHTRMQTLEQETSKLKKVVIEKNKLAMIDALTAIPNRLSYEKKIEEEISRWKRFNNPLSLAIWDIDLFKKVNDTYGHKAGDKVLKTVAQLLNKRIRKTDFLARYGGEEFVMLLPGTRQEETLKLVNELRAQVENCGFHYHGEAVNITISCGISCFNSGDTLAGVFERADQALYKAKANGRNQCVAAACLSD
ncbi:diguanylate cyclase (GGDEF domain) [hydrothermal vent metagenome]|uniref:Diguanylate cyclase (GGDEF domain) n=1 Tax=hydrothermal vent metagenome TaxID=652676 RepID=A0A3B0XWA1_9ZZZZ